MLKKEIQEQQDARMHMKRILTYVENQNVAFYAAPHAFPYAAMPLDAALMVNFAQPLLHSPTPSETKKTLTEHSLSNKII